VHRPISPALLCFSHRARRTSSPAPQFPSMADFRSWVEARRRLEGFSRPEIANYASGRCFAARPRRMRICQQKAPALLLITKRLWSLRLCSRRALTAALEALDLDTLPSPQVNSTDTDMGRGANPPREPRLPKKRKSPGRCRGFPVFSGLRTNQYFATSGPLNL
jgi:hypothetical protein